MDTRIEEILKEILSAGDERVLSSTDAFAQALKEKGCTEEEVRTVMDNFSGFPLDDDDLAAITGGGGVSRSPRLTDPGPRGI